MIELARVAALIGVLGAAVVFGTDVFCAMVQRPALARVDDRALVAVMGYVHRYGDRRMPIPGVIGLVATAASAAFAAVAGSWATAIMATAALALLLVWLTLYIRVSAPVDLAWRTTTDDRPNHRSTTKDHRTLKLSTSVHR